MGRDAVEMVSISDAHGQRHNPQNGRKTKSLYWTPKTFSLILLEQRIEI